MYSSYEQAEQSIYRLAMAISQSRKLLVERVNQKYLKLPHIRISRQTRHAAQINEAVKNNWNHHSVILDILPSAGDCAPCAVVEIRSMSEYSSLLGIESVSLHEIEKVELSESERRRIYKILCDDISPQEPFTQLGWIDEAQRWLRESVYNHSVQFTADILQLNASSKVALVCFPHLSGPRLLVEGSTRSRLT